MRKILVDSAKCIACHSCELSCAVAKSDSGSLYAAIAEDPPPVARVSVEKSKSGSFPLQCRHCEDAQCLKACVTRALYRDAATGAVLQKDELCIGCHMCAIACPFGSVEQSPLRKTVSKCDLCAAREGEPACVASCPTGALRFEEVSDFSKSRRQEYLDELDLKSGGECLYE